MSLTVTQIRIKQIAEFMYRYKNNLNSFNFPLKFTFTKLETLAHTVNPTPTKKTRLFSIRFQGASTWNSIPLFIRHSSGLASFKCKLRSYLLSAKERDSD